VKNRPGVFRLKLARDLGRPGGEGWTGGFLVRSGQVGMEEGTVFFALSGGTPPCSPPQAAEKPGPRGRGPGYPGPGHSVLGRGQVGTNGTALQGGGLQATPGSPGEGPHGADGGEARGPGRGQAIAKQARRSVNLLYFPYSSVGSCFLGLLKREKMGNRRRCFHGPGPGPRQKVPGVAAADSPAAEPRLAAIGSATLLARRGTTCWPPGGGIYRDRATLGGLFRGGPRWRGGANGRSPGRGCATVSSQSTWNPLRDGREPAPGGPAQAGQLEYLTGWGPPGAGPAGGSRFLPGLLLSSAAREAELPEIYSVFSSSETARAVGGGRPMTDNSMNAPAGGRGGPDPGRLDRGPRG